jgi:RNA-directed DNA polymerase
LLRGQYRFAPMSRVRKANGEVIHIWSSRGALFLKALAIVLAQHLPVSGRCTHVKGHGGAKATVRAVRDQLPKHTFVMRTDVKSDYASIDHHRILDLLAAHINDRTILNLPWQVIHQSVTY